jgi:hypothetical protein
MNNATDTKKRCKDLIMDKLDERIKQARRIIAGLDPYDDEDNPEEPDEIEALDRWALAWDGCTLELSWGGPQDYFTFARNKDGEIARVFYSFLDWGDGATVELAGEYYETMEELAEVCGLFNR